MSGWSVRWCAPAALLAREAGGRSGGRAGRGRRAAREPLGVAAQAGVAPERGARGLARRLRRRRVAGSSRRRPAARARRRPRARRGGRTRSTRPASSTRAGWRRGGRCRRTRRPRTGRAATSARRGRWPRRPSCSGRRARPAAGRAPGRARRPRARRRCWGSARRRRCACRARPRARRCARAPVWIASATSSRGASSSTKRSPSRVQQRRALAADRLGHEEAVARALEAQRGGVELHELEVGEQRAGVARRG